MDESGQTITVKHDFQPHFQGATMRHLGETTERFLDETAVVISGTVSHAGFGAAYFDVDCPYKQKKSDDTEECICPVEGAKVFVIRESGMEDDVELQEDGTFSTAVFLGETVKLGLKSYTGIGNYDGQSSHDFTITYDAGSSVDPNAVQSGVSPTFTYTTL